KAIEIFNQALPISDIDFTNKVLQWLLRPNVCSEELMIAGDYALWRINNDPSPLFSYHALLNYNKPVNFIENDTLTLKVKYRNSGFNLKDEGISNDESILQSKYCLYCHKRKKDSCSFGIEKLNLDGCPVDEKISEMNLLKSMGLDIGALAIITRDNPMCAITGHRICNDCKKTCIFQKQEPVKIPSIETNILNNVLSLKYGFEIYSLLTRWNPLCEIDYILPKDETKYKILIAGLGPAGMTLAHYMVKEGHTVVAIDGSKIEKVDQYLIDNPIENAKQLYDPLEDRINYGFGGVAEYGITVRWNKNYLILIRLILEKQERLSIYGGIKFGNNITYQSAKKLGFDHVALCIGTGKPTILSNIPRHNYFNSSDFLMGLQLIGAYKMRSLANLQMQFPIIVIGCGLTALDVAAEVQEYYIIQVKKILYRYKKLIEFDNEKKVLANFNEAELKILKIFLKDAEKIESFENKSDVYRYLKDLGGVKIVYRNEVNRSPGIRLNHEEIISTLEEGIEIIDNIDIIEVNSDDDNNLKSINLYDKKNKTNRLLPVKTIISAIGTQQNDADEVMHADLNVSIYGDCNEKYAGNVIKAISSAKDNYQLLSKQLYEKLSNNNLTSKEFKTKIDFNLRSYVHEIIKLNDEFTEIVINSPLAVQSYKPGQFFKLQNYFHNSKKTHDTDFLMEPLALTGSQVDRENNLISLVVQKKGASSFICQNLKKDEEISFMGPIGKPLEIAKNENILIIADTIGSVTLLSFMMEAKKNNTIDIVSIHEKATNICKKDELIANSHKIIWLLSNYDLNDINCLHFDHYDRIIIKLEKNNKEIIMQLKEKVKKDCKIMAHLNAPMQCMMNGVCGQCVHKNNNGELIFTCKEQYLNYDEIDFDYLNQQTKRNGILEKIASLWVNKNFK
ncbi:MAG: FAD-dependent oxidoreductase, partial [Anaplasmataceae bacterium]|nr:FAD-dependent oxidoreductase [Anaplasmataceae bacterium]